MSQYIIVSTPTDVEYQRNLALSRIIIFLGEKYKAKYHGKRVQAKEDFKLGLNFINNKCGKRYKNTIRNLMQSKRCRTMYNVDHQKWKIHKSKAERFFYVLKRELVKLDAPEEVWNLFDYIYKDISRSDILNVDARGRDIIAYPYKSALITAKNNNLYTLEERNKIKRVLNSFKDFDQLYTK